METFVLWVRTPDRLELARGGPTPLRGLVQKRGWRQPRSFRNACELVSFLRGEVEANGAAAEAKVETTAAA